MTTTVETDDSNTGHSPVWEWGFIALLVVAFAPAFIPMARVWSGLDYASHGYLVPLVALWAATSKRNRLPKLPRGRDLRGLAVVGAALAAHLVSIATSLPTLAGLSVVAAVAGAVLYLRGAAWLSALVFPISFLLFMVPLPESWITPVIVQLQLFVSTVGVELLQLAGYAVYRDGNVIELPGGDSLFVAEACSGITSVITLLPLGVFLAYFTERTWARRAVLVAAVIPLAMLGNLIRVVGTVLVARDYGSEAATQGALHESAGLFTYVLGCLALLAVGRLMNFVSPAAAKKARGVGKEDPQRNATAS